jgi:hypothetical protein
MEEQLRAVSYVSAARRLAVLELKLMMSQDNVMQLIALNGVVTMDEKAFIQDRIEALEESIAFFSNKNKPERERWDCKQFLATLGVPFDEAEISASAPEPADVLFRAEPFQIKEILDPGRRRQDEYKEQLAKAQVAAGASELLTLFTPKDLTPVEICDLVFAHVKTLDTKYAPADRRKTNLLYYVNLKHRFFTQGRLPELGHLAAHGWRSISVLLNSGAIVLYAALDAPNYLIENAGLVIPSVHS